MRIKNLLMLAAFLTLSGGAMAQTEEATLTAGKVKVVPGHQGVAILNLTTPVEVGGWEMRLALPEGISLASESGKLEVGPEASWADATVFNDVALSRGKDNHQVIGGLDTEGQTLLVCVPKAKEASISGKSGELCQITLTADDSFKGKGTQSCQIKGFLAADPKGEKTYEAAAVTFDVIELKYDVDDNGKVNLADVRKIIIKWKDGEDGYNLAAARKAINEWKL